MSKIAKYVTEKIKIIWKSASIPAVSDHRIEAMLKNFHLEYRNMVKPLKGKKDCKAYSAVVEVFKTQEKKMIL